MRKYIVTVNGNKYEVEVEEVGFEGSAEIAPEKKIEETKKETAVSKKPGNGETAVKSPMPGTILDIKVKEGQSVKKGDVLFILEAMKMENEIMAGEDGVVVKIAVPKGAQVNTDDLLAVLE